jgi:hypothetical protein
MTESQSIEHDERRRDRQANAVVAHDTGEQMGLAGPATAPDYPVALLGNPRLNGRGNQPVKTAVMQRMQRTYGNRTVQRMLHHISTLSGTSGIESPSLAPQRSLQHMPADSAHIAGTDNGHASREGSAITPHSEAMIERAASSSGTPLRDDLRRRFEASLGVDLSDVRIHTGGASDAASAAVGARAYTLGNHIHFADGEYRPDDPSGRHLLAHEVAHTVQQSGGSGHRQNRLEVSMPQDAHEAEADAAADAMTRGRTASVTPITGTASRKVQRKARAFGGYAGTAEQRASAAAQAGAAGLVPVNIDTNYARKRADAFGKMLDDFERGDIPGYSGDKKNHALYPILVDIQKGYIQDAGRIAVAQDAFNAFVEPAQFADKAMLKFRAMQKELGFSDEYNPSEDLSDAQKKAVAGRFDKEKVSDMKATINAKQKLVTGTRKELLGTMTRAKAAAQGKIAQMEQEKADKAGEEKTKIEEKIKKTKEAVDTVVKVVELLGAAATAGVGGGAVSAEAAAAGQVREAAPMKGLEKLGKGSTGLIGTAVEAAMERYYKQDLDKLKSNIRNANTAVSAAKELGVELNIQGEMLAAEGQADQLAGHMSEWLAAMKALKEYYITVAEEAEKATGGKPGGVISQMMAYAAAAADVRPHIDAAKSMGAAAINAMENQLSGMAGHRNRVYGTIEDASYGAHRVEPDGPDREQIRGLVGTVRDWMAQADKDEDILRRAENAIPGS